MDLKKLVKLIPGITAQIAEKLQLGEKIEVNVSTGHTTYNQYITINLPEGSDRKEMGEFISQNHPQVTEETIKRFEAEKEYVATLPEEKQVEFLTTSTEASIYDLLINVEDPIKIADKPEAEISIPKK